MQSNEQLATYQELLDQEIRRAFRRGSFYAALIGLVCGLIIGGLILIGMEGMLIPCLWSLSGGVYSLFVYLVARSTFRMPGWQYVLYLPFVSFPTVIFLLSHFMLPAGAATYFNGPPVMLYLVLTALSGFLFDRLLSILSGVWATIQYLFCLYLALPQLALIQAPDPIMQQDLTDPAIYFFKAVMLFASGFVVGVSAQTARRLMERVLQEQRAHQSVDRLFGQYVSDEVKEKILQANRDNLAEHKELVILFSDLRGFTTWSEKSEPAVLVEHLNEYFEAMVQCIVENGGTVDKFIGDAVMAVFGGLRELPNPRAQAYKAAQAMLQRLNELNHNWARQNRSSLAMGIGLHYGSVIEGTIGSATRKEYTVIGDAVNTAARLESETRRLDCQVLLSHAVYEGLSTEARSTLKDMESIQLKGRRESIRIYGLLN